MLEDGHLIGSVAIGWLGQIVFNGMDCRIVVRVVQRFLSHNFFFSKKKKKKKKNQKNLIKKKISEIINIIIL